MRFNAEALLRQSLYFWQPVESLSESGRPPYLGLQGLLV